MLVCSWPELGPAQPQLVSLHVFLFSPKYSFQFPVISPPTDQAGFTKNTTRLESFSYRTGVNIAKPIPNSSRAGLSFHHFQLIQLATHPASPVWIIDFCGAEQHQHVAFLATKSHILMWRQISNVNDQAPEVFYMWRLSPIEMIRRQWISDRKGYVVLSFQ